MRYRVIETCTGPFALMLEQDGVVRTTWLDPGAPEAILGEGRADRGLLPAVAERLVRYFEGVSVDFEDVPLEHAAPFTRRCWSACRRIPRGQVRTYAELAAAAGSPDAARAAGQAMRRNPLPVIVPCHRVVASGGRLGGFSGTCDGASSSIARKRMLLRLEGAGHAEAEASRANAKAVAAAGVSC